MPGVHKKMQPTQKAARLISGVIFLKLLINCQKYILFGGKIK
jgi:hypothetical protein